MLPRRSSPLRSSPHRSTRGSSARRRGVGLLAAGAAATVALTVAPGAAIAAPAAAQTFPGAVPSWATAANDIGTAADAATVEGEIYLPLRDTAGAQQLATAVSTPGDPRYRQWLSPQQWIDTYSPTTTDLTAVTDFLTAGGFTITAVPKSRQYVVFRGPVSAVDAAFATSLHSYRYAGQVLTAPATAPSVPAAVAGTVAGVSLDQGRLLTRPTNVKQDDAAPGPVTDPNQRAAAAPPVDAPCSTYFGQNTAAVPFAYLRNRFPTNICGYTPSQLRSAYGVDKLINAGIDGSGQTVAIVDAYASPTIVADTNTYGQLVGAPPLTPSTYSQIVPDPSQFSDQALCQFPSGWQGEQTLDVQSAHGIAPGAHLLYVGGFNCGGGLDIALSTILDDKLADVVSNSYGNTGEALSDDAIAGAVNQHVQAAAEGIGLYFSSGDNGDEKASLGYPSPDFPASSPFVTSVGGTSLGVNADGSYGFETGWGSARDQVVPGPRGGLRYAEPLPGTFRGGAGGGTSATFAQPAYQAGVVPDNLARGTDGTRSRVSPDVASLADPYTGFLIGLRPIVDDATLATGAFGTATYGGTSLAAPLTAAQVAVVQQQVGSPVGFANPAVYALDKARPASVRDVTGSFLPRAVVFSSPTAGASYLVTLDRDTSLRTTRGYDAVTGLGSLSLPAIAALASGRIG